MIPIRIPTPHQLEDAPELAALSTLDTALVTAVHALAAAYPNVWWCDELPDDWVPDPDCKPGFPSPDPPLPPTVPLAADIMDAAARLRETLVTYWATRTTTQLAIHFDTDQNVPF
jgi:hypothetical protein